MDITNEIQFNLKPNTKLLTVEELERALMEEQEISDKLLREAEARKKAIKEQLAEAKAEKRKQELHKLTEIVKNLHAQYGNDFVEVVKNEIKFKVKPLPKSELEKAEYVKYKHLFDRGYKASEGKVYNHLDVEVKSNIPAQKQFVPYFTMATTVYARLFEKYNGI